MKTVGVLLLLMVVASVYVFDVAGARRPMRDAYTAVLSEVRETVQNVRDEVPKRP
jgi:hypothetical protein